MWFASTAGCEGLWACLCALIKTVGTVPAAVCCLLYGGLSDCCLAVWRLWRRLSYCLLAVLYAVL